MIFTNQQPPDDFFCDYNCVADLRHPGRAEKWLRDWRKRTGQASDSFSKDPMILGAWPDPMLLSRNSLCAGAGQDGGNIGAFPVAAVDRSLEDQRPPVGRISCGGQDVGGAAAPVREADVTLQIIDHHNWTGLKTWQKHGSIYGVVPATTSHEMHG